MLQVAPLSVAIQCKWLHIYYNSPCTCFTVLRKDSSQTAQDPDDISDSECTVFEDLSNVPCPLRLKAMSQHCTPVGLTNQPQCAHL